MAETKIEWADKTWNPITGCTPISEGCQNCYAKRMSKRLAGRCGYPKDKPFAVTIHRDKFEQPLHWKKPSRIFVCSMGDLFDDAVPFRYIHEIWDVMKKCPQHNFLILTKRPEIMRIVLGRIYSLERLGAAMGFWSHIWLGVTAETQQRADERIPILLQTPAAKRFVSVEPMLGQIDLKHLQPNREVEIDCLSGTHGVISPHAGINEKLDWVICGGETGPGARPMHPDWARSLRDQCQAAGTPFFFKSWGEWVNPDQTYSPYNRPFITHHFVKNKVSRFGEKDPDMVIKMGKNRAGRLLDGREWNEYPEARP